MKIHLVASNEEKYSPKKTKMNIALKYSKLEDYVSVIIFKSILEVTFQNMSLNNINNQFPGCLPRKVIKAVCKNIIDGKLQRAGFKEGLVFKQQENI